MFIESQLEGALDETTKEVTIREEEEKEDQDSNKEDFEFEIE
jgi:hypothetical protein